MNMAYASTYLYILRFHSAVSYDFPNTGLLKFVHRYFILFEAIVNGIIFLISTSDSSSLVHKNATDFWIFILYPAALLNSLISSSSFLVEFLGFSI